MEKHVRELAEEELHKREAEEEMAEEEFASLGHTLRKDRRNRTRSSSEGQSDREATIITGIMCVIYIGKDEEGCGCCGYGYGGR